MPDQEGSSPVSATGTPQPGNTYVLSGDYRGAILNIESTVGGAQRIDMPPRPRIFISYSWRDDKPFVERLHADLETAGFIVWRDERDLESRGPDLPDELCLAIDECDRFLPVIGPAAFLSPMVQGEWAYARDKCKPVTAVWRLGVEMPPDFGRALYEDFRADRDGYDYAAKVAALQRKLRAAEFPPGPLLTALPIPPQGYIERNEFARLAALFRPDFQRAAITGRAAAGTLHAAGGLGKTVLAAIFARDCATRRRFPHGVVWLTFGKTPDVIALQAEVGRALGDDPREYTGIAAGKTRLQQLLAEKRVLLVFDDVWDYRHAEALLIDAPDCRWLVTTRRGDLGAELGLAPGQIIPLDYLSEDEGLALIAGRLGLDAAVAYEERETHRAIARELNGYTQGIAIAAARLAGGQVTAAALLARYRARRDDDPFRDLKLPGEERERNLELSFKESYDYLDKDDRRRFRALGVFAPEGTFGVDAAAAVWEDEREAAEDGLARLVNLALLTRAGEGRYSQHSLLRAYALALLEREGEKSVIYSRRYNYIRDQLDHFGEEPELRNGIDGSSVDVWNIKQVAEWRRSQAPIESVTLVLSFFSYTTNITGSQTKIQTVLTPKTFPDASAALPEIREAEREDAALLELLHENLSVAERHGQMRLAAEINAAIGDVRLRLGHLRDAEKPYLEAVRQLQLTDSVDELAEVHQKLGSLYVSLGRLDNARLHFEAVLVAYGDV